MHASGLWLLYMPDGGVFAPFSLECLCRLLLAFCMYILAVMLRSEDFLCGIYICPSYTFVLVHFSLYSLVLEGVLCFICSSFALLCIRFIEAAQWHFLYHGSVFFLIKKTTFCLCKKKKVLQEASTRWSHMTSWITCLKMQSEAYFSLLDYEIMYMKDWYGISCHTPF